MYHLSALISDEMSERILILVGHRQTKNPKQKFDRTDILADALNIGVKVMEAEAFSGIQLLVSKEIS